MSVIHQTNHHAVFIILRSPAFDVFVLPIKQAIKVPRPCAGQTGAAHLFVPLRHLPVQQRPGAGGQEPLQTHLLGVVAAPQRQQELPELPLHPQPRRGTFPLDSLVESVSEDKAHHVILSLHHDCFGITCFQNIYSLISFIFS